MKYVKLISLLATVSFQVACSQSNTDGIPISEVEGMVHLYGKKRYNTFSGKWTFKDESTWLLLKNGKALKNPNQPLKALKGFSATDNSEEWIDWKEDERFTKAKVYPPSPKGARYDMSVTLYSVNGSPISSSVTNTKLELYKDGRFETSVFSLVAIGSGDTSNRIFKNKNKEGEKTVLSGKSNTGTGTVSTVKKGKSDSDGSMSGTYSIEGHTITLTFDSGEEKSFLFATDSKDHIILGNDFYFKKKSD